MLHFTLELSDDNWETINGDQAHYIEVLNATNQINLIDAIVIFLLAHRRVRGKWHPPMPERWHPPMPDEVVLRELHRTGTILLLDRPGTYRNVEVVISDAHGAVVYAPPLWQSVGACMSRFFRDLSSVWTSGDALDVAAFALWKINWIHPFRNGNGRTARAFAYACLCLKMGTALPGTMTVIDQIMADRPRYQAALRAADEAYATDHVDISELKALLHEFLERQIDSAVPNP